MPFLKKPSYIISRFSQSGWGRLLFTYTHYFDNLPIKRNTMLFEVSFRAFEQVVVVAESAAFQLLQAALRYSIEHSLRLYVALYSCAEDVFAEGGQRREQTAKKQGEQTNEQVRLNAQIIEHIKQALLEAGFSNEQLKQCVFIKRHSKRYMRVLASAAFLLADEGAFPSFFIRKKEQCLFCVPDENSISKLDRHMVQNCMNFAHMQHVLLQSSFIACSSDGFLQALIKNSMISQIYKGSYVVFDFSHTTFEQVFEQLFCAMGEGSANLGVALNPKTAFNLKTASNSETASSADGTPTPSSDIKIISAQSFYNQKAIVAIYGDTLRRTGIQSSLRSLFSKLDVNKANFVLVHTQQLRNNDLELAIYDGLDFLNSLPEHIEHYGVCKGRCMRYVEALAWVFHVKLHKNSAWVQKRLKKVFEREQKRTLAQVNFDTFVHFTGYDFEMMNEMIHTSAQCKAIFIHSDMEREVQIVKNVDVWSLRQACKNFDVICPVQPTLVRGLASVVPSLDSSKVKNVHNCIDNEKIIKMSQLPLKQTDYEHCSVSFDQLQVMLKSDKPTFVWLGRYTAQKGADRLLEAFEQLLQNGIEANLIMAGSCGELYPQICEQAKFIVQKSAPAAKKSISAEKIPVIKDGALLENTSIESMPVAVIYALQNPYALLKCADALIISSLHEGFPMVMLEALILEKPVISTDILGVSQFLQDNNYGMIVENSVDGIRQGMQNFVTFKLKQEDLLEQTGNNEQSVNVTSSSKFAYFDAEKYNRVALREFYQALGL